MKVCIIERCYQCRHCCFNSEYAYDREGYCYYKDEVEKELAKSTLEEKTKAELLAMALEKGLEVKPTLKKEEIINLIDEKLDKGEYNE